MSLTNMFERFRILTVEACAGGKHATRFEHDDYRLAAAALLVHAAVIDGNMSDREHAQLHTVIERQFGLDEATANELMAEAIGIML